MYRLSAADFADTGQWRLLINIRYTGLDAYLENTVHPEVDRQQLCQVSWDFDRDKLTQNIEDAVYGQPRLLDDFATKIILFDPRTLFIPTAIAEKSEESEETLYQKVYAAEATDIMWDEDKDITAVWSLAPGIKSFLMRTFPGARITCNLLEKIRSIRKRLDQGTLLYIEARDGETDLILLHNQNLISASTHEWSHPDDIAYLAVNLLNIYDLKLDETSLEIRGISTESEAWKSILKKHNENYKR